MDFEREYQFQCDSYLEIINYLVDLSQEKLEMFFIGFEHPSFEIDQLKLLETMKEMMVTKDGDEKVDGKTKKIVKIVLSWRKTLTHYYRSFNPALSKAIEEFLDSLNPSLYGTSLISKGMSLSCCGSPDVVSQLLSSIMFRIYKNLKPGEFYNGFWEKEEKYIRSPNILAMSETFNRISSMVVESILFCESEAQLPNLMYMIKLANRLLKMQNFEGWAAVVSGLNQSPIRRLKPLWKNLSSRYKKRFELFDEMLSPDLNFKSYQVLLQSVEPPLLPWFAPKLRELRYLYDGNQTKTEEGFLNLPFLMKIGESIKLFLQYQSYEYDSVQQHDKTELMKFLQARSISEDVCYEKSLSLFAQSTENLQ